MSADRGTWAMLAAVVAVVASSCAPPVAMPPTSAPAPTAAEPLPPPVTGQLVDGAGRPVPGVAVGLIEDRGIARDIFGAIGALFSLGISCLAGADPCRRSGGAQTTTGPDGTFSFGPADVRGAMAESRGVYLSAGSPAAGLIRVTFDPASGGDLGTLALWDPHTTLNAAGGGIRLHWSAPPGANGQTVLAGSLVPGSLVPDVPGSVVAPAPVAGGVATLDTFSGEGTDASATVDPRSLEDGAATLVLTAGFSRRRAGQNPRIDWTAPARTLKGAGVPLSRHAGCHLSGRPDPPVCPLTDGDLSTPLNPTSCPPTPTSGGSLPSGCATAAVVDLGRPISDVLVALRPRSGASVEGSTDGIRYAPLGAARPDQSWNADLSTASGPVRYLRVTGPAGGALGATQVSVWPVAGATPKVLAPAVMVPGAVTGGLGGGAVTLGGTSGRPVSVEVTGALAAVLLLAAAVAALGRARGARQTRRAGHRGGQ